MTPNPQPLDHQERRRLADAIAGRLMARYADAIEAIALYGSLARDEDGPYSDIEMFCVLRAPADSHTYEWCAGPWKAEVNVLDATTLRQEAAHIDGRWSLTQGAFVHVLPLIDPQHLFADLAPFVTAHPDHVFGEVIEEVLVGDIYELIGKLRNARARAHHSAIPALTVELARRTACLLGLEHRHLYGTSSSVLDQALTLPDAPQGFERVAELVTRGTLEDIATVASACDMLWLNLVRWAAERGYRIVASEQIPF